MKKLFCSLFAFCSLTLIAQEKTYNFNHKISYQYSVSDDIKALYGDEYFADSFLNIYLGKDGILGHSTSDFLFDRFQSSAFLITPTRYYDVIFKSLENEIGIKTPTLLDYSATDEHFPYDEEYFSKKNHLVALNRTETINGYTCNYYQLNEENVDDTTTVCIDEKSKIDNVSFLIPHTDIKGLIVKLGSNSHGNSIIINQVKPSQLKLYFDENKAISDYQKNLEIVKNQYKEMYETPSEIEDTVTTYPYTADNRYDDPLYNYYSYAQSDDLKINNLFTIMSSSAIAIVLMDNDYDNTYDFDRQSALKSVDASTKKTIQLFKKHGLIDKNEAKELNNLFTKYYNDAKAFVLVKDTASLDIVSEDGLWNLNDSIEEAAALASYQSLYKQSSLDEINLAIHELNAPYYMEYTPNYCKDLKIQIPSFTDKSLKQIVYNYSGQICDLYLYNTGLIDVNSTVDAIRKSIWELSKNYDSYNKEDKEKLKKFLDSLD